MMLIICQKCVEKIDPLELLKPFAGKRFRQRQSTRNELILINAVGAGDAPSNLSYRNTGAVST